jgi:hypothetical protein
VNEDPITIVTVSASAADDRIVELALDLNTATTEAPADQQTLLRRESTSTVSLDPEFSTPEPWTFQVQPAEPADAVSALPPFDRGGSYRPLALDEHLRIEHTPKWVEPALEARLSNPELAEAVAADVQLEYVLGSIDENDTVYVGGIVGQPTR